MTAVILSGTSRAFVPEIVLSITGGTCSRRTSGFVPRQREQKTCWLVDLA